MATLTLERPFEADAVEPGTTLNLGVVTIRSKARFPRQHVKLLHFKRTLGMRDLFSTTGTDLEIVQKSDATTFTSQDADGHYL